MASIDQRYFGPLEAAEAGQAIEQLKAGEDVLPDKDLVGRPLAGDIPEPAGGNVASDSTNRPTDQGVGGA
jgi:hypothetical protein